VPRGRGPGARRLLAANLAAQPTIPSAAAAFNAAPGSGSVGGLRWQYQTAAESSAPPPLGGGIQERISFTGMNSGSRRAASSLRMRSAVTIARVEPRDSPVIAGAPSGVASGVLGGLNLSAADVSEATPAAPREGIQERLPAMPGMRRQVSGRRATGEPRLKAPAIGELASEPIQERVHRVPRAPVPPAAPDPKTGPSPPPSPPERVLPSPVKKGESQSPAKPTCCSLVKSTEASTVAAGFDQRLQAHPKVLPKGGDKQRAVGSSDNLPETWDDRTVREIVWGIIREHTVVGCAAAVLYGSGPKLATLLQAIQLFWGSMLALLFLACAQLRYEWLGATWSGTTPASYSGGAELGDRLQVLSTVGIGGALVGWPCVLLARWLFMLANRMDAGSSRMQALLIHGSAWSIIFLAVAAVTIGAVNMATNLDAPLVQGDVMVGWVLAILTQWLLFEPAVLSVFIGVVLLLKWCTSFEDLPENQEQMGKQSKTESEMKVEQQKQRESSQENMPKLLQLTSVAPK